MAHSEALKVSVCLGGIGCIWGAAPCGGQKGSWSSIFGVPGGFFGTTSCTFFSSSAIFSWNMSTLPELLSAVHKQESVTIHASCGYDIILLDFTRSPCGHMPIVSNLYVNDYQFRFCGRSRFGGCPIIQSAPLKACPRVFWLPGPQLFTKDIDRMSKLPSKTVLSKPWASGTSAQSIW